MRTLIIILCMILLIIANPVGKFNDNLYFEVYYYLLHIYFISEIVEIKITDSPKMRSDL